MRQLEERRGLRLLTGAIDLVQRIWPDQVHADRLHQRAPGLTASTSRRSSVISCGSATAGSATSGGHNFSPSAISPPAYPPPPRPFLPPPPRARPPPRRPVRPPPSPPRPAP